MALFRSASEAQFLFQISGIEPGIELGVVDFDVKEKISAPSEVDLTLASEDEINFDDVIGKEALLTLVGDEHDRYFHGIIIEFRQTGTRDRFHLYQTRMVPSIWLLSLRQDCRIFQKKTVQEIVKQILQDFGITSDRFEFRLRGQYEPKEYCVQYRESDLDFISRLLEEEGIFYFFEHAEDKHLLVFGDGVVNYQPIQGQKNEGNQTEIPFNPPGAMVPEEEYVHDFSFSRQIRPGKVTLTDFNFERPDLDLTCLQEDDCFQDLELYDSPGEYLEEKKGRNLVQIRLQETVVFRDRAEGQSVCPRFIPAFTFKLAEHQREVFNQEYLLVEVNHTGSQPQTLEEQAGEDSGFGYSNEFVAIPSSVIFRPERKTLKPTVEGVQTAIVVGPEDKEIYTDEYGRVKVQFHWDREGKRDENSSCWIRVSQAWAGQGWGGMHIPHVGHEVIVDFLEGDPDNPIITGRVYHGSNIVPKTLPDDKHKSILRDDYGNELVFDATPGDEHIRFYSPHHNSGLELGKSFETWTKSDSKTWTVGNTLKAGTGTNLEAYAGYTIEASAGFSVEAFLGFKNDIFVGAGHEWILGYKWENVIGPSVIDTKSDSLLTARHDVILGAGDEFCLAAGIQEPDKDHLITQKKTTNKSTMRATPDGLTMSIGEELTETGEGVGEGDWYKKTDKLEEFFIGEEAIARYGLIASLGTIVTAALSIEAGMNAPSAAAAPGAAGPLLQGGALGGAAAAGLGSVIFGVINVAASIWLASKVMVDTKIEPVKHVDPRAKIWLHRNGTVGMVSTKGKDNKTDGEEGRIVIGVNEQKESKKEDWRFYDSYYDFSDKKIRKYIKRARPLAEKSGRKSDRLHAWAILKGSRTYKSLGTGSNIILEKGNIKIRVGDPEEDTNYDNKDGIQMMAGNSSISLNRNGEVWIKSDNTQYVKSRKDLYTEADGNIYLHAPKGAVAAKGGIKHKNLEILAS